MKFTRKFTFLLAIIFTVFLAALSFIKPDWEVSHRIVIAATPDIVWDVLTDLESYPQWNRYSRNVQGKLAVGEIIWVEAHLGEEVQRVENTVVSIVPQQELCWQSKDWYGFLARGTRCRWLEAPDSGETVLVHHEVMRGPLAWLIEVLYRERIEQGLALVDENLAQRSQALASEQE